MVRPLVRPVVAAVSVFVATADAVASLVRTAVLKLVPTLERREKALFTTPSVLLSS